MGVQGLWELLSPIGQRVSNDHVRNKVIAVDVSIWLTQFVKAMRDAEGARVRNAHLLGVFRRCVKLLFLAVKPVLIFDGATPALKRRTLASRRAQREKQAAKLRRLAEKLLMNQIKTTALGTAIARHKGSRRANPANELRSSKMADASLALQTSKSNDKRIRFEDEDEDRIEPNIPSDRHTEGDHAPPEDPVARREQELADEMHAREIEQEEFAAAEYDVDDGIYIPENLEDMDDDALVGLPANIQSEVFKQIKLQQRAKHREMMMLKQNDPSEFSKAQIEGFLKNTSLNRKIAKVRNVINANSGASQRIASDSGRQFLLKERSSDSLNAEDSDSDSDGDDIFSRREKSAQSNDRSHSAPSDILSRIRAENDQVHKNTEQKRSEMRKESGPLPKSDTGVGWAARVLEGKGGHALGGRTPQIKSIVDSPSISDEERVCSKDYITEEQGGEHSDQGDVPNDTDTKMGDETASDADIEWEDGTEQPQFDFAASLNATDSRTGSNPVAEGHSQRKRAESPELFIDNADNLGHPTIGSDEFEINDENRTKAIGGMECAEERPPPQGRPSLDVQKSSMAVHASQRDKNVSTVANNVSDEEKVYRAIEPEQVAERNTIQLSTYSSCLHRGSEVTKASKKVSPEIEPLVTSEEANDINRAIALSLSTKNQSRPGLRKENERNHPSVMSSDDDETTQFPELSLPVNQQHQGIKPAALPERAVLNEESGKALNGTTTSQGIPNFLATGNEVKLSSGAETQTQSREAQKDDEDFEEVTEEEQRNVTENAGMVTYQDTEIDPTGAVDDGAGLEPVQTHNGLEQGQRESPANHMSPKLAETLSVEEAEKLHAELEEEAAEIQKQKAFQQGFAESVSDEMYSETRDLLKLFGIPYLEAPTEAEAQCAYLNMHNVVDGIITEDSDAFLFGAKVVYRHLFAEGKFAEAYDAKDIASNLGLERIHLIRLAFLLGSDYTSGIRGVGVVNSMEVLEAFPGGEGLEEFREWTKRITVLDEEPDETIMNGKSQDAVRRRFCWKHRNVKRNWEVREDFPNPAVIDAYLKPNVDTSIEKFKWGKVDFTELAKFCWEKFGWEQEKFENAVGPLRQQLNDRSGPQQRRIEEFFRPHRFAKIRSERLQKAVAGIAGDEAKDLMATLAPRIPKRKSLAVAHIAPELSDEELDAEAIAVLEKIEAEARKKPRTNRE